MSNLACPICKAPFLADDVHANLGIANCRNCRGVLDLRQQARPLTATPRRFTVDDSDGYRVSWRWFRWSNVGGLVFVVLWLAVLKFNRLMLPHHDLRMEGFVFLPFVAVVGYIGVALVVNRTVLRVDGARTLTSQHRPLPYRRGRRLERHRISQLYCRRHVGKKATSYSLAALDVDGKRFTLAADFEQLDDAKWLEARLEERLGIDNRPVEGEAV
jgi:hypothetical protein